ncbi:MAG TPA: hypothetical protein VEC93_21200, partial [Anaerolineae bacterium]|nr:hypothetical protein [Anaerolineae bacterium]
RARVLCQQLNQADALGPILWGLFTFHFVRSDLRQACNLGEELFALAQEQQNPAFLQQAHYALGGALCSLGEFEESLKHFEQGIALYELNQHQAQVATFGVDLGVFCQAWSTHSMWHLGYLDQSLHKSYAAVTLAKTLGHPFSQALAMAYAAMLFQFSRNSKLVQEWAAATIDFCAEHGVGYYDNWATILHGWALAEQGSFTEGIDQMQKGLADFRESNSEARLPYYLTLFAEAYGNAGQVQEGLKHVAEALSFAEKNDDAWYSAETHRLMGDLMLKSDEAEKAESCYQKSLDISRRQKAKSLELRATVSLAQLWLEQNRHGKACDTLQDVFNWFSEGFDMVDLTVARRLLDELS